jgi:hypothetical protein
MKDVVKVMKFVYEAQIAVPQRKVTEKILRKELGDIPYNKFRDFCGRFEKSLVIVYRPSEEITLTGQGIEKYYNLSEQIKSLRREKVQAFSTFIMAAFTAVLGADVIFELIAKNNQLGQVTALFLMGVFASVCAGIVFILFPD